MVSEKRLCDSSTKVEDLLQTEQKLRSQIESLELASNEKDKVIIELQTAADDLNIKFQGISDQIHSSHLSHIAEMKRVTEEREQAVEEIKQLQVINLVLNRNLYQ